MMISRLAACHHFLISLTLPLFLFLLMDKIYIPVRFIFFFLSFCREQLDEWTEV